MDLKIETIQNDSVWFMFLICPSLFVLDGEIELSHTRTVCSKDWQKRMLLFARARNNGTQRAPVTPDQASCWLLRKREKICASSMAVTLQDSRRKKNSTPLKLGQ